ncbi:hypothetical protein GALMADRAFT_910706 [Galerina marginata CBS 339.88]|uniref:Uncharacterized protein n=1 Tax=Galerina marginata (strain CBS 339.88) TaxID=685588 RepID=A0A067SSQ0_GALM3|nr:hypothetical protein GALMADRAFT_910706 [Galerina marginata CBS 339.88]
MARAYPNNPGPIVDSQKAEERIKELEDTNQQNLEKLQAMENRYTQLQRLLDQRTVELRDAKRYMKQPDEHPGSMILKKLEGVNSEIFNTATSLNDLLERSEKSNLDETIMQKLFLDNCREAAMQAVGELLYSVNCQIDDAAILRDAIVPEESMPLQLALQCVLIKWAVKVVGAAGTFPGDDGGLKRVYEMVRSREEKSVSSQWRVIAYGATNHLEESSIDTVVCEIMSVLCISGLSTKQPGYLQAAEKVHRRVKNIEKMLLSLKAAIHEGITSSDMEVVSMDSGAAYDPQTMVDRYSTGPNFSAPGLGNSEDQVLCTVGMGLRKTTMERVAQKTFQQDSELIKLPEVVLVTILRDFKLPTEAGYDEYMYNQSDDCRD